MILDRAVQASVEILHEIPKRQIIRILRLATKPCNGLSILGEDEFQALVALGLIDINAPAMDLPSRANIAGNALSHLDAMLLTHSEDLLPRVPLID